MVVREAAKSTYVFRARDKTTANQTFPEATKSAARTAIEKVPFLTFNFSQAKEEN